MVWRESSFPTEPPVNYLVLMICHTLWDGALFVTGVWVVRLFCASPTFTRLHGNLP